MIPAEQIYLYSRWYCAGWGTELKSSPTSIHLLGREIALFRDSGGIAHAIDGRCPHRFAALGEGFVAGDNLVCPYHGLQFNSTGRCVLNPNGGLIADHAHVRRYPLVERDSALWIWMGRPEDADETRITPLPFLSDARYAVARGRLQLAADYRLLNDNLLDLTHAAYIHPTTVGYDAATFAGATSFDYRCEVEGECVRSEYAIFGVPATNQFLGLFGTEIGDFHGRLSWHPASNMVLELSMTPPGAAKHAGATDVEGAVHMPGAHLITPEGEGRCHYFYAVARSARTKDAALTEAMAEFTRRTFEEEDAPMIERVWQLMGGKELFELKPVVLETDKAAIQARRLLAKLIRAQEVRDEAGSSDTTSFLADTPSARTSSDASIAFSPSP